MREESSTFSRKPQRLEIAGVKGLELVSCWTAGLGVDIITQNPAC